MVLLSILHGQGEILTPHINMKLYIILFFVMMSFGEIFSQNSFYIVPSINTKFGICSTNPFFQFSNEFPQNEYFSLKNKPFHHTKSILLGFGIGWKNEKQKFSIDFTWNQDDAGISNETVLLASNEVIEEYFFNQNLNYRFSFATHRFSLNLNKPILSDFAYLNIGLGLIYLPQGGNYSFVNDNEPFLYNSNTTLKIRNTSVAANKLNFNLSLGLSFDIKWSRKYLFSLGATYSYAINKNLIVHENYYELHNFITNETIKYSYASASKGSGLFIYLSRRIQLYPWKSNKNKGTK